MKSGSTNENRGSVVLKPEENEQVYGLIGNRCQCLAAGVIQLYVTEPPLHREWIKRNTGIITLIRDNPKRSFYLRLYCLQKRAMLWEHELYSPMEYKCPTSYFHTFEAEECMIAFNFADETDAGILRNVVLEKLNTKRQRRQERRSRMEAVSQHSVTLPRMSQSSTSTFGFGQVSTSANLLNGSPSAMGVNRSISSSSMHKRKKTKSKKESKQRLTTEDIGPPTEFRHIAHMGWCNENNTLETDSIDPDLKQFFNKVGVSETQLRDPETRDFIYDFIENRGNMKVFEKGSGHSSTMQSSNQAATLQELGAPPPIPLRTVPVSPNVQTNSYPTRNPPPPPPPRTNLPPPPRSVPPVHRPLPSRPQAPLPSSVSSVSSISSISSTPQPPPTPPAIHSLPTLPPPPPPPPLPGSSIAAAPPPPPPPPLPSFNESESATVNNTNTTNNNNNNNNGDCPDPTAMLMQSIRSGHTLRKVNKNEPRPPLEEDPRDDLLNQIRRGIELKPVTNVPEKPRPFLDLHDGLADALSRALIERARAIHGENEYSTSDTSNDDEWDD